MGMGEVVFRNNFKLDAGKESQRRGRTKSNICLKSHYYVGLSLIQLKLCWNKMYWSSGSKSESEATAKLDHVDDDDSDRRECTGKGAVMFTVWLWCTEFPNT